MKCSGEISISHCDLQRSFCNYGHSVKNKTNLHVIESNKNSLCSLEKIWMIPFKWETSKWEHIKYQLSSAQHDSDFLKWIFLSVVLNSLTTWDLSVKQSTQLHTRFLTVRKLLLHMFYQLTIFSLVSPMCSATC